MWYGKEQSGSEQGLIIDEENGRNVAVAYDKRDTALIAAAPALLAACKACEELLFSIFLEVDQEVIDLYNERFIASARNKALAAISAATGQ